MKFKTIREAAELLNVSESRMRRAIQAGTVPCLKLGNRAVVDVDTVADLLKLEEGVPIEVVSAETGLSVGAIRRAIRAGWMPCHKPGKAYLFNMDKVHAAIKAQMRKQSQKTTR